MPLFDRHWYVARDEAAKRAAAWNEARAQARLICYGTKQIPGEGHVPSGEDLYTVPDYLEHSAGKVFDRCTRCGDSILVRDR